MNAMPTKYFVAAAAVLLALAAAAAGQSAGDLLEQGIYAEEMEGDLPKALRLYDQVIATGTGDDVYVARALYRKGMCHLKAGQGERAQEALAKLVGDFADQEEIIQRARSVLSGLRVVDPALLMPPDMAVYAEIGSPGEQIRTLLNMLQGTPLETQIQGMMAERAGQIPPGMPPDAPPVLFSRLLNPSMINEFQQVQGLAVGAKAMMENSPVLLVLYPGESAALKGILQALVGGIMQPAGDVAGLPLFRAKDEAFLACNDDIFLLSQSMDLVRFAASQYQNNQPATSLAESQPFFTKVPVATRRHRFLTAWIDADGIYDQLAGVMGEDMPHQLVLLNVIGGLEDLGEIHLSGVLEEDRVRLSAVAQLDEGHHSVIYDLVRTPHLAAADLRGIPAHAAAALSLRVGESAGAAQTLRRPLRRWTGLDLGRELFCNVDQLTVSLAQPDDAWMLNDPAQLVALSVTSRHPDQTRNLLHGIFSPVHQLISGMSAPLPEAVPEPSPLSYLVGQSGGRPQHLHMGRQGKTTLLSLNPDLVNQPGDTSDLQRILDTLPPTTSKCLLVNLGRLFRLQLAMQTAGRSLTPRTQGVIDELAGLLGGTHLVVHTEEEENRLGLYAELGPVPDLGRVLPLLARLEGAPDLGPPHHARPVASYDHDTGTARLQWQPRGDAGTNIVLFGSSRDDLTKLVELPAPASEALVEDLEPDTTYYWQAIERWDDATFIPGEVWSFTTAGLTAHYTFDNVVGNRVEDSGKHGNHGTAHGGARVLPECEGRANVLDCNGVTSYVEIPRSIGEGDFTMALWVRTEHEGNHGNDWWQGRGLVDGELLGTFHDFGTSVMDGRFVFGTGEPGPDFTSETSVFSEQRINDGAWHHLVAVRDAATGDQTVYVDGVEQGTVQGSVGPKTAPHALRIGSILTGVEDRFFEGQIDDVRLYSYRLSPDAIMELYETSRGMTTGF